MEQATSGIQSDGTSCGLFTLMVYYNYYLHYVPVLFDDVFAVATAALSDTGHTLKFATWEHK